MSEQRKEAANVYVPHNQEHGPQTDGNAASLLLFIGGVQLLCLTNRPSSTFPQPDLCLCLHTVIIANSHLMLGFVSVQVIKSVSNV